MASEQFSQAVRGSGGAPISVSSVASIETDEYGDGRAATAEDAADYPLTVDPEFVVEEVTIFELPDDKTVDLVHVNGNEIDGVEPRGSGWVLDTLELESITINDPDDSGGETSLLVIGDQP